MKKIILITFVLFSTHLSFGQNNQIDYYKETIHYLASDELEGRLTGSDGEKKSAAYIKNEFKIAGLTPAASDTGFYQTFPFNYLRFPTSETHLLMAGEKGVKNLTFNVDFFLLSQTCDTGIAYGPIFDAGYGMVYPKKNHDDYKKFEHKNDSGKIFLIRLGHPENGSPHSEYGMIDNLNTKISLALEKGASGILFVNPDSMNDVPSGALDKNITPTNIPIFYVANYEGKYDGIFDVQMFCKVASIKHYGYNVMAQHFRSKRKKYMVIGAHHDHLGRAELGSSRAEGQEIHNGADDNASGVAMMLHLAKTLPQKRAFRKYNLLFVAFSGEELGLLGSKYMMNNSFIDTAKMLCMVNFDMVGRLNPENKTMVVNGIGTSPYWKKRTKKIKLDTSVLNVNTTEGGIGASDHTAFYLKGIPAVHIFSGQHREYHTPDDDEQLINYEGMVKIEDYTVKLMCKYPRKKRKFTATKNDLNTPTKFKVTLGVMPDYTFSGAGMRLDNVSEGKTADKAGLLRDDVITQMGEHAVGNVEEYMVALSHYNKGDSVVVSFMRAGELMTKTVIFE